MAYKQKQSTCAKMVDAKGKPSGLMMAGSAYHMESISQEKKNLVNDMPIDGEASAMEMSPYKMHGDPATPHTDKMSALETAKLKAAKLRNKKTSDSLSYAKDLEKQFRSQRGQLDALGDQQLMKDVKKRASEVFDFDIIEPTEKFPKTGVNVNEGTYLGSGYITDGQEHGFNNRMSVSELAKDQPRSGFEQTKAKKISELLGLN